MVSVARVLVLACILAACKVEYDPIVDVAIGPYVAERPKDNIGPTRADAGPWRQVHVTIRTGYLTDIGSAQATIAVRLERCGTEELVRYEAFYRGDRSIYQIGFFPRSEVRQIVDLRSEHTTVDMYVSKADIDSDTGRDLCMRLEVGNRRSLQVRRLDLR